MMELKDKRILVLGKGRTGTAALRFLEGRCKMVSVKDEKEDGPFSALDPRAYDLVVQSPGISRQHPFLLECDKAGIPVTNEIELAYLHTDAPIFGVTGTNGKTTISTLLHSILQSCGRNSGLAGNVGQPLLDILEEGWDSFVLELSSYQLEGVSHFRPRVAIISNLTPDHLERHKTMENYLRIKARIYENMGPEDSLILNDDDPWLRGLDAKGPRIYYFSRTHKVSGIFLREGRIILNLGKEEELLPADALEIPGGHNVENAMAAILAAILAGADPGCAAMAARKFPGVPHRLEFVRELEGVPYYNDSKATNPEASITALSAFPGKRILVILGGSQKKVSYKQLAAAIRDKGALAILQGSTAGEIREQLQQAGIKDFQETKTMTQAVDLCRGIARPGDVVLLSPACASFDQFADFEARGEAFKEYVRSI